MRAPLVSSLVRASELNAAEGSTVELLPRGSLTISTHREQLVKRSIPGAYTVDGTLSKDTLRTIPEKLYRHTAPDNLAPQDTVNRDGEDVVWGGNILGRYGHFLIETVARLWPTLPNGALDSTRVVFTTPCKPPFATEWMQAFGIETVDLPESGAIHFTRMHVPEPAWQAGAWVAPEIRDVHLHARDRMDIPSMPSHDLLWLSRSRLTRERVAYDESLLEWMLDDLATPVHPEEMTLAEQIGMLERSRAIAGVAGSAFHTLLMTAKQPECLYLLPPVERVNYPAQHRLLGCEATFARAVDGTMRMRRARERAWPFPGGYRVIIPTALEALRASVLPRLFENRRLAAFARLEPDTASLRDDLDEAAMRVLRDPFSFDSRMTLAARFEECGVARCALEQYAMVAELSEERAEEAQARAGEIVRHLPPC